MNASRAALRAQAVATAPVVGYLTTNTEVDIVERAGDWCRVRTPALPAPGFLACRFLGDAKLTIGAVEAKLHEKGMTPRDRLDWQSRAFWVSPSLRRLEMVGYAMEQALLSRETVVQELQEEKALRPRNAEFEAMKGRLASGAVVDSPASFAVRLEDPDRPLMLTTKRAALPPIRPSFFPNGEPLFAVALRPFTLEGSGSIGAGLTDALSAVHGVPFGARVLRPASIAYFGTWGVWDIDTVAVTFTREVTVHGVTARGAPTGLAISSLVAPLGNQPCSGSGLRVMARPLDGRWRSAIVAWVGKPGPQADALVTTRQLGGAGKYDKVVIETVDLDRDGVPDFSLWAGVESPGQDAEWFWRAVFGNVGGTWVLLAFNQAVECT